MYVDWESHKRGCTGKIWYRYAKHARVHVNRLYAESKSGQVYRCHHCRGYHVTSTVLRTHMTCPVFSVSDSAGTPHLFRLAKLPGACGVEDVASCLHCGVRIDQFGILDSPSIKMLEHKFPFLQNEFKRIFVKQILEQSDKRVLLLSLGQLGLVRHLLGVFD